MSEVALCKGLPEVALMSDFGVSCFDFGVSCFAFRDTNQAAMAVLGWGRFLMSEVALCAPGGQACGGRGCGQLSTLHPEPWVSGDTTPCRMTGVTLHSDFT